MSENNPSTWRKFTTYRGTVVLYGLVGSSWQVLANRVITRTYMTNTSTSHPTSKSYGFVESVNSSSDFGSGSNRFGIHDGSGATITSFTSVSYSTQTTSNEVALGGNFKFIVHPPSE